MILNDIQVRDSFLIGGALGSCFSSQVSPSQLWLWVSDEKLHIFNWTINYLHKHKIKLEIKVWLHLTKKDEIHKNGIQAFRRTPDVQF